MKTQLLACGIALTLGLGLIPACAKAVPEPEAKTETPAETEAAVAKTAKPAAETESDYSDAMRIPVDGSSLEAFNQSLAEIKGKSTEAEYNTLSGAIQYLMVYDLAAKRDRAKLAKRLDGLTGEEIIGKVNKNKEPKGNRKSK